MQKLIKFFMTNTLMFSIVSLLTYVFYGVVIGTCMIPSFLFIRLILNYIDIAQISGIALLAISVGVAVYIYFITSLIAFGILERILTIGFKPGRYKTSSPLFSRWIIYSGLHVILLNTTLPFMTGTVWGKLFYRILGCKLGKNVFINSKGLHDAYLLEIGDNVVIGGDSNISCHIFEGDTLILGKIKIGNNSLISAESYIMPGVEIGNKCSIGIKAYVRKNKKIEDGSIVMAVPGMDAKKIAELIK